MYSFKDYSFFILILFNCVQLNAKINDQENSILIKNAKGVECNLNCKSDNILSQVSANDTLCYPLSTLKKIENKIQPKIFGSELFSNLESNILPKKNIPKNYQLRSGDELYLLMDAVSYGKLLINNYGNIVVNNYGQIKINGLTVKQAEKRIRKQLSSTKYQYFNYTKNKIVLILEKPRNINVTLIGAIHSGSYQISSLSTLFSLLYLGGGPDSGGSYRNIKVIRNNSLLQKFDLYTFLKKGYSKENVILKEGDIVIIPPYSERVSIIGDNKITFYELKNEEKRLKAFIKYSEDLFPKAYVKNLKISRIVNQVKMVQEIDNSKKSTFQLKDGDELSY